MKISILLCAVYFLCFAHEFIMRLNCDLSHFLRCNQYRFFVYLLYHSRMRRFLPCIALLLVACSAGSNVQEGLVTTLEGQQISLEDITRGKPAIVNFWASWCSFCKEEMPQLQSVHTQFEDIAVVGVNLQEDQAVARAYAEEGGYTFVSLLDPGSELKKRFGVFTQPTTFVLDAQGNELFRKDGPFTSEELLQWVETIRGDSSLPDSLDADTVPTESATESSPVSGQLSLWFEGSVRHTIPLDSIVFAGPQKDEIPSIDSPTFVDASLATTELDSLRGLFVSIEGDARFYPFAILNWHEVVNDTVGGVPISVTYCPLCASAVVYERTTSQGKDTFGVTGLLYQSNLLLYDRKTQTFWSQVRGEAVVGPLTGEKLKRVKSEIVSLSTVKKSWPDAKVLSTDTGFVRRYDLDPYEGYEQEESLLFPVETADERLRSKRIVYGVVVDGMAKAYTQEAVQDEGRLQDTIGSVPILIQYDAQTERVRFTRFFSGSEKKEEILPLHTFWFAWVAQYPDTDLFE